jgi:primase-polymerase (primpol)-like protein
MGQSPFHGGRRPGQFNEPKHLDYFRGRGVGLGFVLSDGIGCIDLDHRIVDGKPNEPAAAFVARYPGSFIEVSPSGDGLHIWGLRDGQPGTRLTVDGLSVETYSTGRYITVTGRVFQRGALLPL